MKGQLILISSILLSLYFAAHAQKTQIKSQRTVITAQSQTNAPVKAIKRGHKHKVRKKDNRPYLTINDVRNIDSLWGIDISHHQTEIDWNALEAEKPHFMFIKATQGIDIEDHKYSTYYAEAKKLGIPVGSYHFFTYKYDGKQQAEKFLSVAQNQSGDLLPVLDAERTRHMPRNKYKITSELTAFIETVYEKLGHYPIIYCTYAYSQLYLNEEILKKCKLWIADYKSKPKCNYVVWQATDRLKLAAIKEHVDLNFLNRDSCSLQEIFKP
ncbi:MAG TPA: glycoside hydrolase family 25 protein [Bacteroidales bacterium]|nr:glycoside hydrolase family 25 protein [Bacteroidales bacterium]